MAYKVFLVEDEIVTREGIRDSVEWAAAGYQFCGEAPDGEIALPLICEQQPEVVITDIRMPFMDGLQLSRALHETLPATKIIILSGHDEFKYAQEAIKAGVTEYLLKPLSAQDLLAALRRVGRQIEHEREVRAQLIALQSRVSDQQSLLRERCVLDILVGNLAPAEIIEQCRQLGIELVAPCYVAMLVRVDDLAHEQPAVLQRLDAAIAATLERVPGVVWCKYDQCMTALILHGDSIGQLHSVGQQLALRLRDQLRAQTGGRAVIYTSAPVERVSMLAQVFAQVLARAKSMAAADDAPQAADSFEISKPDTAVLEQLLKSGVKADIARCVQAYLQPLCDTRRQAHPLIGYVLTDALLTVANVLRHLGAQPEAIVPELHAIERLSESVSTFEQIQALVGSALERTLDYRDRQTHHQHTLIDRARAYIEAHYADADLSLNAVAAYVTLSPSYFSAVFGREVGETFIEYVTRVRLRRAMELLRTTSLTSGEIAACVGYQNPRYFHAVFRKATGLSPIEFRRQA